MIILQIKELHKLTHYIVMRKFFTVIILIIATFSIRAQNQTVVLPTTPEAASLHKFVDIPVDLNSGVPNISIDLFEINFRDFTLPISINYHASGLRVSEISSNIGAGWSLNAGGLISANINGAPDFGPINYFNSYPKIIYDKYLVSGFLEDDFNGYDIFDDQEILELIATGQVDGQPDLFYFSYLGKGGNFVFDETLSIRQIPHTSSTITFGGSKFIITDEKGVVYEFIQLESSEVTQLGDANNCPIPDWFNGYSVLSYTPTWHLKTITSPNGDSVSFEYETVNYTYEVIASQQDSYYMYWLDPNSICGTPINKPVSTCLSKITVTGKRLTSIISSNGYNIIFSYSPIEREDLSGTNALKKVDIYNGLKNVKSWTLDHGYFGASNGFSNGKKLKLLSIEEVGKPPYSFVYDESKPFPSKMSKDLDHWGYYNGKSNMHLLPRTLLRSEWLDGADREPDFVYSQLGTLTSLEYPTGGSTQFEYEANDYWFEGNESVAVEKSSAKLEVTTTEVISPAINTTFTITESSWATINYNIQYDDGNSTVPPPGNVCIAKLKYAGNTIRTITSNNPTKEILLLLPGVYQMELESTSEGFYGFYQLDWVEENTVFKQENRLGGGLRVKTITDISPESSIPKIRNYVYNNSVDTLKSSGLHHNKISYSYSFHRQTACVLSEGAIPVSGGWYTFSRVSSSTTPTQNIRYEYVTTLYGKDGENGKIINKFYSFDDKYPNDAWPFGQPVSYKWQDGFLKESSNFKFKNGNYLIVQKDVYDYEFNNDPNSSYNIEGLPNLNNVLSTQVTVVRPRVLNYVMDYPPLMDVKISWHISAWKYLKTHTKTTYDQNDLQKTNEVTTTYHYDNPEHIQLTREISDDSNGLTIETKYKYPKDYTAPSSTMNTMVNKHIISPVIEQVKSVGGQVVSATGTEYEYNITNDIVLPKNIFGYETNIPGIGFSESIDGSIFSSYNKKGTYHKYDNKGNILEFSKEGGVHTCYIWGYNQTYPVAQVVNATYEEIEDLAGFGNDFQLGAGTLSASQEQTLRNNLSNARITTYTYIPGVGLSTSTDSNAMITYYEYDNIGRLILIKDNEENVLETYEYNYAHR